MRKKVEIFIKLFTNGAITEAGINKAFEDGVITEEEQNTILNSQTSE